MDCRHVYTDRDRQVLPEHENVYKKMTGQSQLLKEAFLRFGDVAGQYYQGLKDTKRSAAGYHMSRILKYADRYGMDVVSGALAHGARFDAHSADSILRIIQGKKFKTSNKRPVRQPIPANVRDFFTYLCC